MTRKTIENSLKNCGNSELISGYNISGEKIALVLKYGSLSFDKAQRCM